MTGLVSLEACLAQALAGTRPVPAETLDACEAGAHVLAGDLIVPRDMPAVHEALRTGLAVASLDLVGASAQSPVRLSAPAPVLPGTTLPAGADAVLPEDGTETNGATVEAIRPVSPGEGVRRAGHDARAGIVLRHACRALTARHRLVAALAQTGPVALRRPRLRLEMDDPALAAFAQEWARELGGVISGDEPHLILRTTADHRPRLALAPGETAWLERVGTALVLTLPARVDGMVAALLALGLPVMAALNGASPRAVTRPLARKVVSGVGLSEIVLLTCDAAAWAPAPAGTITLAGLATAEAFALLPPESEGQPSGANLTAIPLNAPFG